VRETRAAAPVGPSSPTVRFAYMYGAGIRGQPYHAWECVPTGEPHLMKSRPSMSAIHLSSASHPTVGVVATRRWSRLSCATLEANTAPFGCPQRARLPDALIPADVHH